MIKRLHQLVYFTMILIYGTEQLLNYIFLFRFYYAVIINLRSILSNFRCVPTSSNLFSFIFGFFTN